jgi:ribosome-associated translation inhibitor RaiA
MADAEPAGGAPPIELHAPGVGPRAVELARRELAQLARYTDRPLQELRLTLRTEHSGHGDAPIVADASVLADGRLLSAHARGPAPQPAVEQVVERLRRQLRRIDDADVALRNEPRTIRRALAGLARERPPRPERARKPPEQRHIVHRRSFAEDPRATYAAIADLLDDDLDFLLFTHRRSDEDVVVHRHDESGRIGLIHPRGSVLADEADDVVLPVEDRFEEPLPLSAVRVAMDVSNLSFAYFVDEDGRGRVLYLRFDGDYGLVEP